MGLDIYHYRVQKNGGEQFIIPKKHESKFEKLFSGYLYDAQSELFDLEATFDKLGLTLEHYNMRAYSEHAVRFASGDKNISPIELRNEDILKKTETNKALRVKEIGYQRKGMDGDWTKPLGADYFDGVGFAFDEPTLEHLLKCADRDAKNHFKKKMVDKFVGGKTFLWFFW